MSSDPSKESFEQISGAIYDLAVQESKLEKLDLVPIPGFPATEAQIRSVETALHRTLPRSYRLFLSVHNGWKHWMPDHDLLSTDQMLAGEYFEQIKKWKKMVSRIRPDLNDSLVIGFAEFDTWALLLDFISPSGEDVVSWETHEYDRHPDFYSYLVHSKAVLEQRIRSLQEGKPY